MQSSKNTIKIYLKSDKSSSIVIPSGTNNHKYQGKEDKHLAVTIFYPDSALNANKERKVKVRNRNADLQPTPFGSFLK